MGITAVLCLVLITLCFADQAVQNDWTQGPGVTGPETGWGSCFDSSQDISWMAVPGQIALASDILTDPVYYSVDPSFAGAYTVDVGDINGDGLNDIVGGGYHQDECCVWYADGSGSWEKQTISSTADGPCGVDVIDIDNDGDLDVLCGTYNGEKVILYLNDGASSPQWTEVIINYLFNGCHDVEGCDMDDDGDIDVLAASALGDRITWWRNDGGSPIQWFEQDISTNVDYPCRIQAIDLDGDGCMDVTASMWEGDNVLVWYGSGGGTPVWTEHEVYDPVYGAHSVRAGDVDMDGDPDLIVTAMSGHQLLLFRNDGSSPVQWTREIIDTFSGCAYARPGDVDGDGDWDIVTCSFANSGARWYENEGDGTSWAEHQIALGLGSVSCAFPADVDSDGDLDALITCFGTNKVLWYELTEFVSTGWLVSSILDTEGSPQWASIDWDACLPGSTNYSVSYKTSDNSASMGSWSAPIQNPAELSGLVDRYFQYRIQMGTADPSVSPVLKSFQFNWDLTGIEWQNPQENRLSIVGGNPVQGSAILRVTGTGAANSEIIVFDCSGRQIWSSGISMQNGNEEYMQVPPLPAGSYRILLREDDETSMVMPMVVLN
ncbi:MAG: VCBS repeat-containing protein [Candidatus Aegiribacteria sp.]|nr:VCBS repeat-containing protein [Candidatus Aegiribacteria sp.]